MPKIRVFLWRVIAGAIVVADRLQTRGLVGSTACKLYNQHVETVCHVLFECPTAQLQWDLTNIPCPLGGFTGSLEDNLSYVLDLMEQPTCSRTVRITIPWIMWGIWKNKTRSYMRAHRTFSKLLSTEQRQKRIYGKRSIIVLRNKLAQV